MAFILETEKKVSGTRYIIGSLVVILSLWSVITYSGLVGGIFLPSPTTVLKAFVGLIISGRFFVGLAYSFSRILTATILSVVVGVPIGIMAGYSFKFQKAVSVITHPMRYLPTTALLPLLILWLGIGESMKIIFLFVGIVFYLIPLVANSVEQIKREYILVAMDLGLSHRETLTKVIWPAALPQIWDSIIVVNGLGWTYVILAEIINAHNGLGYMLNIAGRLQRSPEVFAELILITIVALLFDRLLRFIGKKYFSW